MGRIRVQWRSAGRAAALLMVGLAGLQVLPGLLRPPQAPPLAADVGLPQLSERRERAVEVRKPAPKLKPQRSQGLSAATALIGTTPRQHKTKRRQEPVDLLSNSERKSRTRPRPAPPPVSEPAPSAPPPASEPVPAPAPEPAPPPGDGSVEFAPH